MNNIIPSQTPVYAMTSLYVGDLHNDVTEAMLFEKFSLAGPVLSIRVCRDMITRRSLGYAYINYQQSVDAERAMDSMNFDIMKGHPIRIMWSQRDPSLRKSGRGNIFIKNLDKSIDNKDIYDTFSTFGAILSCKVATDENGNSKGYGFVHFETEEAANKAIEKVNGMLLSDKKLFVGRFVSRQERDIQLGDRVRRFNNVFVKNFPESLSEDKLKELFEKFGAIISCRIMFGEDGQSKCFGFVAFEDPLAAEAACLELNGYVVEGKVIYAGRAQRRSERQLELKKKFELVKAERIVQCHGINLYVKNLDETFDDDKLRSAFEVYGSITSAKVMKEDGRSKGFGFVCFSAPEEATKAIIEMNGQLIGSKPLYVGLAQSRENRLAALTSQHMQRMVTLSTLRMPPTVTLQNQVQFNPANFYVQTMQPVQQQRFYAPVPTNSIQQQQQLQKVVPRWPQNGRTMVGNNGSYPPIQAFYRPPVRNGLPGINIRNNSRPGSAGHSSMGGSSPPKHNHLNDSGFIQQQSPNIPYMQRIDGMPGGYKMNRPPPLNGLQGHIGHNGLPSSLEQSIQQHLDNIENTPGIKKEQEPLNPSVLAAAHPCDQKQMLGERLYPIIQQKYPEMAGKVTGMLLEMDNSEILHLLEDEESLISRVDEALSVLSLHAAGKSTN